jgi:hypothetical protein
MMVVVTCCGSDSAGVASAVAIRTGIRGAAAGRCSFGIAISGNRNAGTFSTGSGVAAAGGANVRARARPIEPA